tara:strand:+ start:2749 stop:3117 length:369 start_codon:yes stop_codon:yes gene_type:complete
MEKNKVDQFQVFVVYALPHEQRVFAVWVSEGTTALQAIEMSGVLDYYPQIDIHNTSIGIFSEIVPLDHIVSGKERIEIYRPLVADPKELRKKRAQKAVHEGRANQKTGGRVRTEATQKKKED